LQNLNPVGCQPDANFIQSAASWVQISFSQPQSGWKFHSVGRQPDANCIWLVAMQYKITSLHLAGDQPNEICILLAANQKQILQKKGASTLLSC
jgi:hypothetical protein